ncbi:MAG: glycosyltransferase family 4 protein [Nitrosospira sp.]|nr:glycosyltransferase family 4 protein [Nitrosospira sp.]
MRLLIDGVFFQLNNTGIARVWRSIVPTVAARNGMEVLLLDRGGTPAIDGVERVPFPSYEMGKYTAADSLLIQQICEYRNIDVFTSTYYSTPVSVPMVLMLYDMIPELFQAPRNRPWTEKDVAINYAQRFVCISQNTRRDLLAIYPEIPPSRASVGLCGVDPAAFKPRTKQEIAAFKNQFGLGRPYVLLVGSRHQLNRYKNSALFFDAISRLNHVDFDVLCVGGESEIDRSMRDAMPQGATIQRVELTDDELGLAYNGAQTLVYPSLYEGFGMPVLEAMACGCPVITTQHGSLAQAAGNAACVISGESSGELLQALDRVREPAERKRLRAAGLSHASRFRWRHLADAFVQALEELHAEAASGMHEEFFHRWRELRELQASVDMAVPNPVRRRLEALIASSAGAAGQNHGNRGAR